MNRKVIVLTGATSGIGYEVAKIFAAGGHTLIFIARSEDKSSALQKELKEQFNNDSIHYFLADFASFKSIKHTSESILTAFPVIDVLVNNAGVWEMERKQSEDGIEMNFAVNYLAPFLLTELLLPALKKAPAARIVNTSSMAHRRNILYLDDLEFKHRDYDGIATYSQSKLCNILFTLQLQTELSGTDITANTVHPGYVKTCLFDNMGARDWGNVPPASEGARSTVFAALSPKMEGISGKYIYQESEDTCTAMAQDKDLAKKLWSLGLNYIAPYLN